MSNIALYLCEASGNYAVYSRVSSFRKWIEEAMIDPVYCSGSPDVGGSKESKATDYKGGFLLPKLLTADSPKLKKYRANLFFS